jgi:mono/diheme cytochrome c family protein
MLQEAKAAWSLKAGAVLSTCLLLGVGCGQAEQSAGGESAPAAMPAATPPGVSAAAAQEEAKLIFGTRCFTCHGPEGKGDGPGSVGLQPPPRNFTDPEWQSSVNDPHIETIIMYGGVAVGKSPAMPANPDLNSKPEVVAALRAHVRSLGSR